MSITSNHSPGNSSASTARCPACGASNRCSLADPRTATQPCWCFSVSIDPAVLEALPAELRDQACLCPTCARVDEQLKASHNAGPAG